MGRYSHFTLRERGGIMAMRSAGASVRDIARAIGRNKPTVSRELSRNRGCSGYRASAAQGANLRRRAACVRPKRLDDPELAPWSRGSSAKGAGRLSRSPVGSPSSAPGWPSLPRRSTAPPTPGD